MSIIRKWRNFGTTRTLPKAGHSINPDKSLQLPFPPEKTVNHLNGLLDCEKQDPLDFKPSLNLSPRVHHVWRKQNSSPAQYHPYSEAASRCGGGFQHLDQEDLQRTMGECPPNPAIPTKKRLLMFPGKLHLSPERS